MASSEYGRKLNPFRRLHDPLGVKGVRQSVVITNNPSTIDQNQQLLVRFPNLGAHDVIVPGTARLAFTIALTSTDANKTVVQNLGRAIVKKTTVRISGNEVLSIDDSDVYHTYCDLWKAARERENGHYQGIDTTTNRNATRIRVGAGNKDVTKTEDKAIATAFNDYGRVILADKVKKGSYGFENISLEPAPAQTPGTDCASPSKPHAPRITLME